MLEFDSTRKCMSVILEPLHSNNKVLMLTKGAETAMLSRCVVGDKEAVMNQVNDYAALGLRTLVIAQRYLTQEEYNDMAQQLNAAATTLVDREEKMAMAYDALEQGLTLLGCTGIEDKLQDGVRDTIESLRMAGIQVGVTIVRVLSSQCAREPFLYLVYTNNLVRLLDLRDDWFAHCYALFN